MFDFFVKLKQNLQIEPYPYSDLLIFQFKSAKDEQSDIAYQTEIVSRAINVGVQMELIAPGLIQWICPALWPGETGFLAPHV